MSVAVDDEIRVIPYDPQWPVRFEALRAAIWPAIADVALRIEHVGSTSVPGLHAKPILDIDIVTSLANVSAVIERLARLGYRHLGNLGIVGREALRPPTGSAPHHLYICTERAASLRNHLALRDYLRSNPAAALGYRAEKQRLARRFPRDIDAYTRGKSTHVLALLRETGAFDEAELQQIERDNGR